MRRKKTIGGTGLHSKVNPKPTKSYEHQRKHYKSFRIRHVGLLIVALALMIAGVLEIGIYLGKIQNKPVIIDNSTNSGGVINRLAIVKSSLGFSFGYDNQVFDVDATQSSDDSAKTVATNQLSEGLPIISANLKPRVKSVDSRELATRLSINVNKDLQVVQRLRQSPDMKGKSDGELAASLYEITSDSDFDVTMISSKEDTIDNVKVQKRTYQYTPKFGSQKAKVFSVQWTGIAGGRAFSIHLKGLIGGTDMPQIYQTILDTFSIKSETGVLGLSTSGLSLIKKVSAAEKLDSKYQIDSISPAVVKIYHIVCGTLVISGQQYGKQSCGGATGSGFFISSEGHIATNGHVVVFNAEDLIVQELVNNPASLVEFLKGAGYSDKQISAINSHPDVLASIIASIYDMPPDQIKFANEQRTYLVSLGTDPIPFEKEADLANAYKFKETDNIKKASLVGVDYSAKDILVVSSGDEQGFSASDVAILKIDDLKSPVIKLSDESVAQGQKINILGFPGDAENMVISNTKLSVSVTSGAISAIRDAAGGKYKLYQSDADASHGNSGGPALNDNNQAIGVLTYRYKNTTSEDAAKSYIRAIEDLKNLAKDKKVTLSVDSETQSRWDNGLRLFSENRFSKSLKEFENVNKIYPAHRLVSSYIDSANKGIADGKDVKDFPVIMIVIIVIGGIGTGVAVWLIARHRGHHQVYKMTEQMKQQGYANDNTIPPPSQTGAQVTTFPVSTPSQQVPSPPAQQQIVVQPGIDQTPPPPTQVVQ